MHLQVTTYQAKPLSSLCYQYKKKDSNGLLVETKALKRWRNGSDGDQFFIEACPSVKPRTEAEGQIFGAVL